MNQVDNVAQACPPPSALCGVGAHVTWTCAHTCVCVQEDIAGCCVHAHVHGTMQSSRACVCVMCVSAGPPGHLRGKETRELMLGTALQWEPVTPPQGPGSRPPGLHGYQLGQGFGRSKESGQIPESSPEFHFRRAIPWKAPFTEAKTRSPLG